MRRSERQPKTKPIRRLITFKQFQKVCLHTIGSAFQDDMCVSCFVDGEGYEKHCPRWNALPRYWEDRP